ADVTIGVVGREDQHSWSAVSSVPDEFPDRGDTVAARHAQVHEDDVRFGVGDDGQASGAAVRLADHVDAGLAGEDSGQAVPDDRMVVDDDDPDGAHRGTFAAIVVPWPGSDSTIR